MKKVIIFLTIIIFSTTIEAQAAFGRKSTHVSDGNEYIKEKKYAEALESFNEAQLIDPLNPVINHNIGHVLYRQNKYKESYVAFERSQSESNENLAVGFQAVYNQGNALYRQGRLPESLEKYKAALELNPDDEDTKYNIEFVEKKIEEMKKEAPKTKEQAKKDQEKEDKKEKDNQQNQDKQKNQDKEKNQDQKKNEDQKNNDQKNDDKDNGNNEKNQNQESGQNDQNQENEDQDNGGASDGGDQEENQNSQNQRSPQNKESDSQMASGLENVSKEQAERILSLFGGEERKQDKKGSKHPVGQRENYIEKYW